MFEYPAEPSSSRSTLDVCQMRMIVFGVTPAFRMISAISLVAHFPGHLLGLSVPQTDFRQDSPKPSSLGVKAFPSGLFIISLVVTGFVVD